MILHNPILISARLLPSVKVGNAFISIEYSPKPAGGRQRYQFHIDTPELEFTGDDLKSGMGGGSLQSGLESLLSFLGAAAESYRYKGMEGGSADLFPEHVTAWAAQNADEITMLELELSETPDLIEE